MDSIIFDLDGTLWDSTAVCAKAWNHAISTGNRYDITITAADMASIMGLTTDDIRKKLLGSLSIDEGRELMKECFKYEVDFIAKDGASIYDGVTEGVKYLSTRYKLYIVSNCHTPYLNTFLDTSNLRDHFVDCECFGATGRPKDENIKLVVDRNNIKSPIYCGDTMGDQTAAKKAGVTFLFCEYGFGKCDEYDYSAKSFQELVTLAKTL